MSILLPVISEDTGMSVTTLQWAVTGYSLVGAAVIITSGSLGAVFGRKRIFQLGLLLFVASCVFIALSKLSPQAKILDPAALASGLGAASWVMAIASAAGVLMAVLLGPHREPGGTVCDAAASAAAVAPNIPTSATPISDPDARNRGDSA